MAKRRMFGEHSRGQGKKPARGIREFKSSNVLAHSIEKMMGGMQLHDLAGEIIRANGLVANEGARTILRLGLQKAFLQRLWKTGKRGDIATQGEKAMFQLIRDAETIRSAVWCAFTERTPIKKTGNVFSAVAEIMQRAQSEFKGSKQGQLRYFKKIEQNARANVALIKSELARGAVGHAESLNERQLLRVAGIGEKMIATLSRKLPADAKTGFVLIEKIVRDALRAERQ